MRLGPVIFNTMRRKSLRHPTVVKCDVNAQIVVAPDGSPDLREEPFKSLPYAVAYPLPLRQHDAPR